MSCPYRWPCELVLPLRPDKPDRLQTDRPACKTHSRSRLPQPVSDHRVRDAGVDEFGYTVTEHDGFRLPQTATGTDHPYEKVGYFQAVSFGTVREQPEILVIDIKRHLHGPHLPAPPAPTLFGCV